jgi:hypothetical protein
VQGIGTHKTTVFTLTELPPVAMYLYSHELSNDHDLNEELHLKSMQAYICNNVVDSG